MSVICRFLSVRLATPLHVSSGAILANTYRLLVFVDFRQPVISLQVSFSAGFSFFACAERSHTGHAYSAAE